MNEHPLPGNTEAEEQVLACILSYPRSILRVIDTLKPEHFATPDYGNIYDCMCALTRARRTPTTFNVADELVRREMRSYEIGRVRTDLSELSNRFALDTRLEDYAASITRASRSRRLAAVLTNGIELAYRQEENGVERVLEALTALANDGDLHGMSRFDAALDRYMDEIDTRIKDAREGRILGVRTGFRDVDRMIGSLQPGTLNIIAARTSIGKTSFALNVALNIAQQALTDGKEVGFFSLEMRERELVQRLLSMDSHIDSSLLRDGRLTDDEYDELKARAKKLRPIGLHISDTARQLDAIKGQARILCAHNQIGLLILDYLQMMQTPANQRGKIPRHELVAEHSQALKYLAQDLNVPILALAQLNREAEKSDTPQLHHIGDSDEIARDADMVAFLHVSSDEIDKRNKSEDYFVDFLVGKQRNGQVGQVRLYFRPYLTRFDNVGEY